MSKTILVTGGLGYIGSHTTIRLIEEGYHVLIIDNLSNSKIEVLDKIEKITGIRPTFYHGDVTELVHLVPLFENWDIESVIHFAAYKSVSGSINLPIQYYRNNVNGLTSLLFAMHSNNVKNLIFSSSCTVYGEPDEYPVTELTSVKLPKTPYGVSKYICELILKDSTTQVNSISLRYFNPIGNHESGIIFEDPNDIPENLMPYIIGVIKGKYDYLRIWGDDYNTPDGTAIRDYIHVVDLANAHLAAIKRLFDNKNTSNSEVFNVGTGNGNSVLEIVETFEKVTGIKLNYKITDRRKGDIEKVWADTSIANKALNWKAEKSLADALISAWKWEQKYRNLQI